MHLKSIDNPRPTAKESGAVAPPPPPTLKRDVHPGSPGTATQEKPRSEQFLVREKRPALVPPRRVALESLLTDVDRRKQIIETDLLPWRMICALAIKGQSGQLVVGTGWIAGPHTVMTAGHCVFDPADLGGWATKITVTAGSNGDKKPAFDAIESRTFSTTDLWLHDQNPDYDYAAIQLTKNIGDSVGTFSFGVLADDALKDRMVNISGYPLTPGNGKDQYFHANRIKAVTARRLFYDIDTLGGQSGAPVWAYEDGQPDVPVVVGIHAYGVGAVPAGLNVVANSGPRIVPEVMEVLRAWLGVTT